MISVNMDFSRIQHPVMNSLKDLQKQGIDINNPMISETGNTISGNKITGNGWNGISIKDSTQNTINGNVIGKNGYNGTDITQQNGIYLLYPGNINEITKNTITRNKNDGILLQGSSVAEIHYNSIVHNGQYGVETQDTSTANAQNNWWGSNRDPQITGQAKNNGGTLVTTPWLTHPPYHY